MPSPRIIVEQTSFPSKNKLGIAAWVSQLSSVGGYFYSFRHTTLFDYYYYYFNYDIICHFWMLKCESPSYIFFPRSVFAHCACCCFCFHYYLVLCWFLAVAVTSGEGSSSGAGSWYMWYITGTLQSKRLPCLRWLSRNLYDFYMNAFWRKIYLLPAAFKLLLRPLRASVLGAFCFRERAKEALLLFSESQTLDIAVIGACSGCLAVIFHYISPIRKTLLWLGTLRYRH